MEPLSAASSLGKHLVLPSNIRLDWKEIARYKHSSLFGLDVSNEGKKFYNIDTRRMDRAVKTKAVKPGPSGSSEIKKKTP